MIIEYVIIFFLWLLLLYIIHRAAHILPVIKKIHAHHHGVINKSPPRKWHWNNLFLFNDDWTSTVDLWISEVIPTILFSAITGHWWVLMFYYIWAALIQESVEHNKSVNLYPLTCGRWHMTHHSNPKKNYGLIFPLWDKIFRTELR